MESYFSSLCGVPIAYYEIPVTEGWNLIGSLALPININQVTSSPPGIIVSSWYEYASAYRVTDTLQPMKGHWVKVFTQEH
jgi:hypothetical protein